MRVAGTRFRRPRGGHRRKSLIMEHGNRRTSRTLTTARYLDRCPHLLIVNIIVIIMTVTARDSVSDRYICPQDWTLVQTSKSWEVFCFKILSPMPFHQAAASCHSQYASVLSDVSLTLVTPAYQSLIHLLAEKGVRETWYGFYMQDNRLRIDNFQLPPTLYEMSEKYMGSTDVHWGVGEPSGNGDCVQLIIDVASESCYKPSNVTDSTPEKNYVRDGPLQQSRRKRASRLKFIDDRNATSARTKRHVGSVPACTWVARAQSSTCYSFLPFVCVKPAFDVFTFSLHRVPEICQADEYGSYQIPICISPGNETVNFYKAETKCLASRAGTSLYNPEGIFSRLINKIISDVIIQSYDLAWVSRNKTSNTCQALSVTSDPPQTISRDCAARLPTYLCESAAAVPEAPRLWLDVQPGYLLQWEEIPGTSDVQVCISKFSLWNFPVTLICAYDRPLVPVLQNVTVVKGGFPVVTVSQGSKNFTVMLPLFSPLDYQYDSSTTVTDYYWCEVNDPASGTIKQSRRIFMRISEMEIYAASIVINSTLELRTLLIMYSMRGDDPENVVQPLLYELMPQTDDSSQFTVRWLRFRPYRSSASPNGDTLTLGEFYVTRQYDFSRGRVRPGNTSVLAAQAFIRNAASKTYSSSYFILDTLRVKSLDFCLFHVFYDPIGGKSWNIPDTPIGHSFVSPDICLANNIPYVRLDCTGDKWFGAEWSGFVPNQGCNFTDENQSRVSSSLRNISLSDINTANVADRVNETNIIFTRIPRVQVEVVDLVYVADILQKATFLKEIPEETGRLILEIANAVANVNITVLQRSDLIGNTTNRIIQAIDRLGDCLMVGEGRRARIVTESLGLEVWNLSNFTAKDFSVGLELQTEGGTAADDIGDGKLVTLFDSTSRDYQLTDTAIMLPASFVRQLAEDNSNKNLKVTFNLFANTALFKHGHLATNGTGPSETLNTKVISAKLSLDGAPVTNLSGYNVTTAYIPVVKLADEAHRLNSTCVFWDFQAAGGRGGWSSEGCHYHSVVHGRDVCVCNHLTNFAVLLDFYGQNEVLEQHQLPLTIITIIGLSLSIAGLFITILSFLLIKKLRQGRPQQTLFNMALAMLGAWIVFLGGIDRVDNRFGCIAVAVMLHYLILSSFLWMLMEGILQYLLFVKVLGISFHKYLLKTAIPAWGIPLIPVIVVLAVDTNLYLGGDRYCWMALTPFYFAFLLPVGLIVLTNIIIYCLVMAAICRRRNVGSTSAESKSHFRVVGVRASLACFVILGLSWIFAFFAVADARLVFQYLFTITTSVQGFLLFAIFTARDPAVRTFWRERCCGKTNQHSTSAAKARTRDVSADFLESPMSRSTTSSDTHLDLISKQPPPPSVSSIRI